MKGASQKIRSLLSMLGRNGNENSRKNLFIRETKEVMTKVGQGESGTYNNSWIQTKISGIHLVFMGAVSGRIEGYG